ncbi:MAG: pyridoxal phosphate-dependent aminotransferase [Litorimonas sp.]
MNNDNLPALDVAKMQPYVFLMTQTSDFLSTDFLQIGTSATMAMTQMARDMRAAGQDVISLSMGEPDFETPAHICEAAMQAIQKGRTRYTAVDGIDELKAAIRVKFARENSLDYGVDEINVSPGGKAVLFNALAVTVSKGDEVIIPAPCWVSYPDMVTLCAGQPVIVPCGPEQGFKLTPEQLEAAITKHTKWLILNSPSNPTGAVYSADELRALAQVLSAYPHVLILCDDIYEHIIYDDLGFTTMAQIAPDLKSRILTMNGVSKAYAMTGWRIGYAGGPKWLISAMRTYMGQTTSNPSSVSQWAATAALNGPQSFLKDWQADYSARRDYVTKRIAQIDRLSCDSPAGAFYSFVGYDALSEEQTDVALALDVLQKTGVATIAGSAFHMKGHLRLSYSVSQAKLETAFDRLADYFQT